jgi:hypothetical protein
LRLSQEFLAHSHISTTADIYVHGAREAKAGKATELSRRFVSVFFEEPDRPEEVRRGGAGVPVANLFPNRKDKTNDRTIT